MSYPVVLFPDSEALLTAYYRANLDVRAYTELPADLESKIPAIQVTRIGGSVRRALRLDAPRLDVDCFAGSREEARDLAAAAQAHLFSLRGRSLGGAVITRVIEEVGPSWRPDFNESVKRYGFTSILALRPA